MFQPVTKFLVPPFQNFLGPSPFSCFTKQLQTTDCEGFLFIFRMSDDCYFRRAAQLPQCNRRNIMTVLRAVVISKKTKKNKVTITRSSLSKRDAYTETLTQVFSINFEENYEHDYTAGLPLK